MKDLTPRNVAKGFGVVFGGIALGTIGIFALIVALGSVE